jgi:hypothetical protein
MEGKEKIGPRHAESGGRIPMAVQGIRCALKKKILLNLAFHDVPFSLYEDYYTVVKGPVFSAQFVML